MLSFNKPVALSQQQTIPISHTINFFCATRHEGLRYMFILTSLNIVLQQNKLVPFYEIFDDCEVGFSGLSAYAGA